FCQAEDGIRDFHVTGVQTCALPILLVFQSLRHELLKDRGAEAATRGTLAHRLRLVEAHEDANNQIVRVAYEPGVFFFVRGASLRSEERRVGAERSYRWRLTEVREQR